MANKHKEIYSDVNLLYESYNASSGTYVVTISWWCFAVWDNDEESYNDFKHHVLWYKKFKGGKYSPKSFIVWTSDVDDAARKARVKQGTSICYKDFQIILRLSNPIIVPNPRGKHECCDTHTFKANLPTIKEDVRTFLDFLFSLPSAPEHYAKKKDALAASLNK